MYKWVYVCAHGGNDTLVWKHFAFGMAIYIFFFLTVFFLLAYGALLSPWSPCLYTCPFGSQQHLLMTLFLLWQHRCSQVCIVQALQRGRRSKGERKEWIQEPCQLTKRFWVENWWFPVLDCCNPASSTIGVACASHTSMPPRTQAWMLSQRRLIQILVLLISKAQRVIETKALIESKWKTSVTLLFLPDTLCSVAVTFYLCDYESQVQFSVAGKLSVLAATLDSLRFFVLPGTSHRQTAAAQTHC